MKKPIVNLLTFSITLSISVWWLIITEIVLLLIVVAFLCRSDTLVGAGALLLILTTGKAIHRLKIKKD